MRCLTTIPPTTSRTTPQTVSTGTNTTDNSNGKRTLIKEDSLSPAQPDLRADSLTKPRFPSHLPPYSRVSRTEPTPSAPFSGLVPTAPSSIIPLCGSVKKGPRTWVPGRAGTAIRVVCDASRHPPLNSPLFSVTAQHLNTPSPTFRIGCYTKRFIPNILSPAGFHAHSSSAQESHSIPPHSDTCPFPEPLSSTTTQHRCTH